MKVIKGIFKNRPLSVPPNIRAVSLRVKKSLFDVIKDEIEDKTVLDLFGGSGSLGIEALSLEAEKAVFVDISRASVKTIQKNLSSLKLLPKGDVILKDVFKAIKDFFLKNIVFDIVFLDPPYYKGLARKTLQALNEYDILSPRGLIVITCYYKDSLENSYKNFSRIFFRNYGQTRVLIYRNNEESTLSGHI